MPKRIFFQLHKFAVNITISYQEYSQLKSIPNSVRELYYLPRVVIYTSVNLDVINKMTIANRMILV